MERYLIIAVATFGIAYTIANSGGAFNLFALWRSAMIKLAIKLKASWLGDGAGCSVCIGFWLSVIVWLMMALTSKVLIGDALYGIGVYLATAWVLSSLCDAADSIASSINALANSVLSHGERINQSSLNVSEAIDKAPVTLIQHWRQDR